MTGLSFLCCRQILRAVFHCRLDDVKKVQQNDDRDGNPDKPQQNAAHKILL
jgi:hypothetical protein